MSKKVSLFAIDKDNGSYVHPKFSNKKRKYICPECDKDLVVVKGNIRIHHYRHKPDALEPCHYYDNPGESQIHKDAKLLLKQILNEQNNVQFYRQCSDCNATLCIDLPVITNTSMIQVEHRFEFNEMLKIADVAHVQNGDVQCIYEICNTHKTSCDDRPEPWVEIEAVSFLNSITHEDGKYNIKCIRNHTCDSCIEYRKIMEEKHRNWLKEQKEIENNNKKLQAKKNFSYLFNKLDIKPDIFYDYEDCFACYKKTKFRYNENSSMFAICTECICEHCEKMKDECKCH